MRFGKNIKLASILDYKDNSLVFVKYALLDKKSDPIFDTGKYQVYNSDKDISMVYNTIREDNNDRIYLIEKHREKLGIKDFKLYSDGDLLDKINDLNEKNKTK